MCKECLTAGLVEADQELPELALVLWKNPCPSSVGARRSPSPTPFPETFGLAEARALEAEFQAGVGGEAIEHL